ncbi:MAG: 50S ribosomal protein L21 [Candidatus Omnitrophota bacterium]
MYAVIQTGGKQYKVSEGDEINVERLEMPEKDKEITIKEVLLVSDGKEIKIGKPLVVDAKVICEVVCDFKADKVISFKYRRRKSSMWKKGHRQLLTRLKIKEIKV